MSLSNKNNNSRKAEEKRTFKDYFMYGLLGKRKKSFYVVTFGVLFLALILLGVWVINSGELLYGEWDCGSNIRVLLNKNKTFEMYDSSDKNNLDINGKFTIDDKKNNFPTLKYTITLKTNNRVVSGEKLTDDYTTQYEISMDGTSQKSFSMINTVNYNIYKCEKIKN